MNLYKAKKMTRFKWMWIKIWGNYFKIVSPFNNPKKYYLYHKKIYDVDLWNQYFKSLKTVNKKGGNNV